MPAMQVKCRIGQFTLQGFFGIQIIMNEMFGRKRPARLGLVAEGQYQAAPPGLAEHSLERFRRVAVFSVFDEHGPPSELLLELEKIGYKMLGGEIAVGRLVTGRFNQPPPAGLAE